MKTLNGLLAQDLDYIRVEALAGRQLMARAETRDAVLQQAERTTAEIVRLVVRGRTRLLVLEGNKKAASALTPAA